MIGFSGSGQLYCRNHTCSRSNCALPKSSKAKCCTKHTPMPPTGQVADQRQRQGTVQHGASHAQQQQYPEYATPDELDHTTDYVTEVGQNPARQEQQHSEPEYATPEQLQEPVLQQDAATLKYDVVHIHTHTSTHTVLHMLFELFAALV